MSEKRIKVKIEANAVVEYNPDQLYCKECAGKKPGEAICGTCTKKILAEIHWMEALKVGGTVFETTETIVL